MGSRRVRTDRPERVFPSGFTEQHAYAAQILSQLAASSPERDRASELLGERHLHDLDELNPQIRTIMDPAGRLLYVSPSWERLTGRSAEEVYGHRWLSFVHPDDAPVYAQVIADAHRRRSPYTLRFRSLVGENEYRWFQCHSIPKLDKHGALICEYAFFDDIHEQVAVEERLRESEENYRYTVELSPQIPWFADPDGRIREMSPRWYELIGMDDEQALGHGWAAALHPDDHDRFFGAWMHAVRTGEPLDVRGRLKLRDGSYAWFRSRAAARRDSLGRIVRWYGLVENVHDAVMAETRLAEKEAVNRSIVEASADFVVLLDLSGRILFMNDRGLRAMGLKDASSLQGHHWAELWPVDAWPLLAQALTNARSGGEGRFMAQGQAPGDAERWWDVVITPILGEDGRPFRLSSIARDVTGAKQTHDRMLWNAGHDGTTGLPNRSLFKERLSDAIGRASSTGCSVGLLLIDLDHFKQVNDTVGHDAGDMLLKLFSERLQSSLRVSDSIARVGGDEFAVVMPELRDVDDVERAAQSLLARLREPLLHEGRLLDTRASIGASIFPAHGRTPTELFKNADIALNRVKSSGRGRFALFSAEMRAEVQQRFSMINIARDAVREQRIFPYYQPKVRLDDWTTVGFEALLRWRDPSGRVQAPGMIAPAFEDLVLAVEISDRIFNAAIEDMRAWCDAGVDFGHVAVNVSAVEFQQGGFAERVLRMLDRAQVPREHLQIEVTETVFLGRGAEDVEEALRTLCHEGVRIALDDFGTGHASLTHLKRFPVDIIKIDRSFVQNLDADADNAAIVRAVVTLGQNLGLEVVAEGVETREQAAFLSANGCQFGQGFLFSKAVAARRVPEFVSHRLAPPVLRSDRRTPDTSPPSIR